jgi:plasmid stability protein
MVRNLGEEVKVGIKRYAAAHERSLEEGARDILCHAVKDESVRVGSLIAARFRKVGLRQQVPEVHGQAVVPAEFDA